LKQPFCLLPLDLGIISDTHKKLLLLIMPQARQCLPKMPCRAECAAFSNEKPSLKKED